MVEELAAHFETPRMVRGALLARTEHGTAFDAFRDGDLGLAAQALQASAGLTPRDVPAPSQRVAYDREQVLLELEHQRDVPDGGMADDGEEPGLSPRLTELLGLGQDARLALAADISRRGFEPGCWLRVDDGDLISDVGQSRGARAPRRGRRAGGRPRQRGGVQR